MLLSPLFLLEQLLRRRRRRRHSITSAEVGSLGANVWLWTLWSLFCFSVGHKLWDATTLGRLPNQEEAWKQGCRQGSVSSVELYGKFFKGPW